MRVALITDGIWPYVLGGMQKHSYYLCKYLAKNQVYVDLFHFNQSDYDISQLEFFSTEEKKFIRSTVIQFPVNQSFPGHYIYRSYKYSKLIFENLKASLSEYDFIYTKGFAGWYLIKQKYKGNLTCAPIGIKFHGYEMFQQAPNLKTKLQHLVLLRYPVKQLSQRADVVFSYGGKITEIIKKIGVKPERIFEMPSGVEASAISKEIKITSKPLKFLFLGRYERRKGLEELNRAILQFQKVQGKRDVEFHFIGPLPESKHIQGKGLTYHGEIRDKEKLQQLIRGCDILLCPSWSEGMPNVILEAMAAGLAVLATDVGANSVLVGSKTGWLIKQSNETEIQTVLNQICLLPLEDINNKKKESLLLIKSSFVWDDLIKRFCKAFLSVK